MSLSSLTPLSAFNRVPPGLHPALRQALHVPVPGVAGQARTGAVAGTVADPDILVMRACLLSVALLPFLL